MVKSFSLGIRKLCLGLPMNLVNKNAGCSVKCEFQISNTYIFLVYNMFDLFSGLHLG